MPTVATDAVSQLRSRAVVFAHLAHLVGPDVDAWSETTRLDEVVSLLSDTGDVALVDRVVALRDRLPFSADDLRLQWTRWFDQGRIPPYECSNKLQSVAGHTGPLADIAGFYRAFGIQAQGDRPDHLVAELEFMAFVTLAEADALDRGSAEQRDVAADAARKFLRDHLGGWVDAWAARVASGTDEGPWSDIAAIITEFIERESHRRNVIPVRSTAAFADNDLILDETSPVPECGADVEGL